MLSKFGERTAAVLGIIIAITAIALVDFIINGNWLAVFITLVVAAMFIVGVRRLARSDVGMPRN